MADNANHGPKKRDHCRLFDPPQGFAKLGVLAPRGVYLKTAVFELHLSTFYLFNTAEMYKRDRFFTRHTFWRLIRIFRAMRLVGTPEAKRNTVFLASKPSHPNQPQASEAWSIDSMDGETLTVNCP
jgi:hypothetical protein